jgi:4-diphosphocytidyl-2-C-methyl-D-erythritol kinase
MDGPSAQGAPSDRLCLECPAKINLFLHVLRRRPDGYHDIVSLMSPLELADRLWIEVVGQEDQVLCENPDVPRDGTNLALKAARKFFAALGRTAAVRVRIDKRIPVAAGLGGGSSNAAAVLLGLNRLFGQPLSGQILAGIGASVGADVPFFLLQQPALAEGIGERITPVAGLFPWMVVLAALPLPVSTASVYAALNLQLTNCEEKYKDFLLKAKKFDVGFHLCNDLESVTIRRHPQIDVLKQALQRAGAAGVLMSGSGPSVFGLFAEPARAKQAAAAISRDHQAQVLLTRLKV